MRTPGIAIVSGGLDSVTMLYDMLLNRNCDPTVVSFDYGQRHARELDSANYVSNLLGLEHITIDVVDFGAAISQNAPGAVLVKSDSVIPQGHYAAENMKATVVPNRNMVMLSMAVGVCIATEGQFVATAIHSGDHEIYPDCRPDFIGALSATVKLANEGFLHPNFHFDAPFIYKTKSDIAQLAFELDVPIDRTWSCYVGGDLHCGRCGTCVERLEAIASTGHDDPTTYDDSNFWRTQVGQSA
jgi:7-cyano-7-deazaguanine synthase